MFLTSKAESLPVFDLHELGLASAVTVPTTALDNMDTLNMLYAPMTRISFAKILGSDADEAASMLEACRVSGFFYLDLNNTQVGEDLLEESEDLLQSSEKFFSMPLKEKNRYSLDPTKGVFGYKPAGTVKKTDSTHRPDATEFLNVAKDHIHGITDSRVYPDSVAASKTLFQAFTKNAHDVGMVILGALARGLQLPEDALQSKSLFTESAGDHCRLTHKLASSGSKDIIGLPSHTDFGSVTILFNWLGGLQIQSVDPSKAGEWEYVKPIPGHAIINLGDAMAMFTNGFLKSAKHRVVSAPLEQACLDRYSVVYFVRPHNDVLMKPIEKFSNLDEGPMMFGKFEAQGEGPLTAKEWMRQRAAQMGA